MNECTAQNSRNSSSRLLATSARAFLFLARYSEASAPRESKLDMHAPVTPSHMNVNPDPREDPKSRSLNGVPIKYPLVARVPNLGICLFRSSRRSGKHYLPISVFAFQLHLTCGICHPPSRNAMPRLPTTIFLKRTPRQGSRLSERCALFIVVFSAAALTDVGVEVVVFDMLEVSQVLAGPHYSAVWSPHPASAWVARF